MAAEGNFGKNKIPLDSASTYAQMNIVQQAIQVSNL